MDGGACTNPVRVVKQCACRAVIDDVVIRIEGSIADDEVRGRERSGGGDGVKDASVLEMDRIIDNAEVGNPVEVARGTEGSVKHDGVSPCADRNVVIA